MRLKYTKQYPGNASLTTLSVDEIYIFGIYAT
jgi:hypothetical protein